MLHSEQLTLSLSATVAARAHAQPARLMLLAAGAAARSHTRPGRRCLLSVPLLAPLHGRRGCCCSWPVAVAACAHAWPGRGCHFLRQCAVSEAATTCSRERPTSLLLLTPVTELRRHPCRAPHWPPPPLPDTHAGERSCCSGFGFLWPPTHGEGLATGILHWR